MLLNSLISDQGLYKNIDDFLKRNKFENFNISIFIDELKEIVKSFNLSPIDMEELEFMLKYRENKKILDLPENFKENKEKYLKGDYSSFSQLYVNWSLWLDKYGLKINRKNLHNYCNQNSRRTFCYSGSNPATGNNIQDEYIHPLLQRLGLEIIYERKCNHMIPQYIKKKLGKYSIDFRILEKLEKYKKENKKIIVNKDKQYKLKIIKLNFINKSKSRKNNIKESAKKSRKSSKKSRKSSKKSSKKKSKKSSKKSSKKK